MFLATRSTVFELLAIVQVEPDRRVRCGAPDCTKTVYARIHVIREDGAIKVLGSTCFDRLYGGGAKQTPRFTSGAGTLLTEEERRKLLKNTEQFIHDLEAKMPKPEVTPPPEPETAEMLPEAPRGPSRNVVCHYCHKSMTTTLLRRPARGYRCGECKLRS